MPEKSLFTGETVERTRITDDPHQRYSKIHPCKDKELEQRIPILLSVPGGNIVRKKVTNYTIKCPECLVEAKYTHSSEPVCPECGMICAGPNILKEEQLVRDAKAAGRID